MQTDTIGDTDYPACETVREAVEAIAHDAAGETLAAGLVRTVADPVGYPEGIDLLTRVMTAGLAHGRGQDCRIDIVDGATIIGRYTIAAGR